MPDAIDASTMLCGILLHPAGHTRSPAMHNAAFRALEVNAVYLAFDVEPPRLPAALEGARALPIRQLAVSLPHKEAVLAHLDHVSDVAQRIGAVNTVTWRSGRLEGDNTDWLGALRALEHAGPLPGRRAVVLGAGGSARAVVYALLDHGFEVTVLNRTPERAAALARDLGAGAGGSLAELARTPCDVLVNTTSVGLGGRGCPVEGDRIPRDCVVLDAVYEPEWTPLLRAARERGARTVSGKWMLIHQAEEQLRLWLGRTPPLQVLAEAFEGARGRG